MSEGNNGGGSGKAVTSLVLGIISVLGTCIPLIGLICGIPGIVFGALGRKSPSKGMATAGLVISIIGLILSILMMFCYSSPEFWQGFEEGLNSQE